jgi:signal peptidase I
MERRSKGGLFGRKELEGPNAAQDDSQAGAQAAVEAAAEPAGAEEEDTRSIAKRLALKVVGYGAVVVLVLSFVIGVHQIHDNDMYPSLRDGDLVITFKLGQCYTGDAVVYEAEGKTHYGRVVAVAGDTIEILEDGYYEVNGNVPYERVFYPTDPGTALTYPYRVEPGKLFIMGDMRKQATDSRTFGAIPESQIKGKVVLVLFRGREI